MRLKGNGSLKYDNMFEILHTSYRIEKFPYRINKFSTTVSFTYIFNLCKQQGQEGFIWLLVRNKKGKSHSNELQIAFLRMLTTRAEFVLY